MKALVRDIIIACVIAFIIALFIRPTIVKESSMQPTLYENNYILISERSYTFGEPERGDIVVFHSDLTREDGHEKLLIKRIIGLPGDIITIANGKVHLNGELLNEKYIKDDSTDGEIYNFIVPKGEVFVMGDNRPVSVDSRTEQVGCVKVDDIMGKAFFRLYPFNEIGTLYE